MERIALFYGSSTCYTEIVAEKIRDIIGEARVDLFNVADADIAVVEDYHLIIMGIPTWDYGELQEDWEAIWDDLDELDFTGKQIALFGLGDQIGYPQWFLDAMGYLHDKLVLKDAQIVGQWPIAGYEFNASKALTVDEKYFVGLALDEENEFDKSEQRLQTWCSQILSVFDGK